MSDTDTLTRIPAPTLNDDTTEIQVVDGIEYCGRHRRGAGPVVKVLSFAKRTVRGDR